MSSQALKGFFFLKGKKKMSYTDYLSDNNRHVYTMENGKIIETVISRESGKVLLRVVLK